MSTDFDELVRQAADPSLARADRASQLELLKQIDQGTRELEAVRDRALSALASHPQFRHSKRQAAKQLARVLHISARDARRQLAEAQARARAAPDAVDAVGGAQRE